MRHVIITLLLIFVTITSCYKDDSNYNYYYQEEPEIENNFTPIDSTNIIFRQHIIETQATLLSTFVIVIRQAMFQPELYGLVENMVEVRACPNPSLVDNVGDGFDKTLTLLFADGGAADCMANGITFSGDLVVDFEAGLGQADPDAVDVQLSQINSFVANGFAFSGGTIDLEYDAGFGYTYTISGSPLVCTKGGVSTSIPVGTTGTFAITDEGEDITMPQLWVDNPFELSLDDAVLTCTNAAGDMSTFCTGTEENIQLNPFDPVDGCSCPVDGLLRIRDGNTGPCGTAASEPLDECNSAGTDFGDGTCTGDYTELESVIEFFYYEGGGITGAGGATNGCVAVDMGVAETSSTTEDESLQRTGGPGSAWTGPAAETWGDLNAGQVITGNPSLPWVNEIHYDNNGGDNNEFIEIAGPAGFDLTGYKVQFINGSGDLVYDTQPLSGVIDDEGNGYGALFFDPSFSIQNGGSNSDGFALVKCAGAPEQFESCN